MKAFVDRLRSVVSAPAPFGPLTQIAIKHGTDKFGGHLYTPVYDRLFQPLRRQPIRLLEIGVGGYGSPLGGGLSLATWAEYFPRAAIVGLDIAEKRLDLGPRVTIVRGSQTDPVVLDALSREHGPFDIVIDDGSHIPSDVVATFRRLYPCMTDTGLYVVEDTQTSLWPDFQGRPDGRSTIFELMYEIGLAIQAREVEVGGRPALHTEFGDITQSVEILRNMIVFKRGRNTYPSNNGLAPDDPQVVDVRASIANESLRRPSPGAYITRIDMELCGQRTSEAISLSRQAMARYPNHVGLLAFVCDVFERCGCVEDRQLAARALARVRPDDEWVRHLIT